MAWADLAGLHCHQLQAPTAAFLLLHTQQQQQPKGDRSMSPVKLPASVHLTH